MDLQKYREEFFHPQQDFIFLNHAGVSPLPRCTEEAMKRVIDLNRVLSPEAWKEIQQHVPACRLAIARFLNVNPDEIALTRNTTEGINWVANGIDWHAQERIVSIRGEYPANIYPWMRLRRKGVIFHLIQPKGGRVDPEMIEQALTPGTRLLTLSFVQFTTGFRADLEAIGRICKRKGVLFMVDVIQGLGALPVDLKAAQVSFAAGGAQKWLLGPQGGGFFYCASEHLGAVNVTSVGSDSMARPIPYLDYEYELRKDAARFEYATLPTLCIAGMRTSVEMILKAGAEEIGERIHLLTDILIDGAKRKGCRCHSPRGDGEWSGIAAFTHPLYSNETILSQLRSRNIIAFEREGCIRFAPHFYQTEEEMRRVVDAM